MLGQLLAIVLVDMGTYSCLFGSVGPIGPTGVVQNVIDNY